MTDRRYKRHGSSSQSSSNGSYSSSDQRAAIHYDEHGPYQDFNGAHVYMNSATNPAVGSNNSNAATYPSRATGFTNSLGQPIYSSSDPTYNRGPSEQRQNFTGHPSANYGGHYAAEASSRLRQTSAPPSSTPLDPHYVNPYQQAMDPHGSGPEPSTKMVQDYKGYKYDDYDLEDAESSVKAIYRAGGPVGPKGNKSTIEGHGRVAEIANRGIQNLRDTRWGRTEMTKDYVGYDDKESAGGHERHIRYLGGRENKLVKKRDLSAKLSGTSEEEEEDDPRVKGQVTMKVMEEEKEEEEVHKHTITRRSSDIK